MTTSTDICLLADPRAGQVIELRPGSQLGVTFRRRGLVSEWHVEDAPSHLLPLAAGDHEFSFLVFPAPHGQPREARLRLVRTSPGREEPNEVRELTVRTAV